jgi:alkanesulfonate monooxygenase SsuD/methylene tetrahydromethanopterin reductase-like flavin-dependent oxidoreductase (luciferase family)
MAPRLRLGLSLPNMADPDRLVDLGVRAEESGWDGVFLWDHVHGSVDMQVPVVDPWVVLGAMAVRTRRVRLGTAITAVARRRPQKLAREATTVDHLSGGRMILGVGLGEPHEEFSAYGEDPDPRVRAEKLDEGLEVIDGLWSGELFSHRGSHFVVQDAVHLPRPLQRPRIPVWTACVVPHRAPLARAARWDGVLLASLGSEGSIDPVPPAEVRRAKQIIEDERHPGAGPFDVVVSHAEVPSLDEREALAEAGATWVHVSGWIEDLDHLVELARTDLS